MCTGVRCSEEHGLYEPGEDTMLLARGVELIAPLGGASCEIGCGSGLITLTLSTHGERVVATDLNYRAVATTWAKARRRGVDWKVDVVCCDRLEALREGELFKLIAFNPPYLPSEGEDIRWSGGAEGIEVPLSFLESALKRLAADGIVLFLLSSLSNWRKALQRARSLGLVVSILRAEGVGLYEDLLLILAARRPAPRAKL
ncbi:MAG: methyltransferase [Thermoproteales archaeon]|nr:methyltransferase [Thermoproteales archaeon]